MQVVLAKRFDKTMSLPIGIAKIKNQAIKNLVIELHVLLVHYVKDTFSFYCISFFFCTITIKE